MKRHNMPIQRYDLLDGDSYGKRYQMVEETNGDWVWYEDVEALEDKCAELESQRAELLKALKRLLGGWQNDIDTLNKAIDFAHNAITKAKGEQP